MPFRIVITTTLNNNLFHAKLVPLVRAREDIELVVVTDRQGPAFERVRWVWPQGALARAGRLGGRLALLAREVAHRDTKLVMAYNVLPHGLFAVTVGHFFRRPVWLNYISGQAEIHFAHDKRLSDNRWVQKSGDPKKLERLAQWVGRQADHVLVPGSRTQTFLQEHGYPPEKVTILHSTTDPARFFTSDAPRDIDVLVAAQVRARKRPIFTLEVMAEILRRRPQTRFCWLGDGPMRGEFEAAIHRLGLERALTWTTTDRVEDYYRCAKIFLLCSVREGLSLACMEAMGCGMVPVAADSGDMSDAVRTGETGMLMEVNTPQAEYATNVIRFLEDDGLWRDHSRASADLILREHSFDSASAKWRELLASLAR